MEPLDPQRLRDMVANKQGAKTHSIELDSVVCFFVECICKYEIFRIGRLHLLILICQIILSICFRLLIWVKNLHLLLPFINNVCQQVRINLYIIDNFFLGSESGSNSSLNLLNQSNLMSQNAQNSFQQSPATSSTTYTQPINSNNMLNYQQDYLTPHTPMVLHSSPTSNSIGVENFFTFQMSYF